MAQTPNRAAGCADFQRTARLHRRQLLQVGGLAGLRCHRNNLASLMNRGSTWVAGERSGQMRPYVRPVSWGSPLAIMGVRLRVRHQSQPRAQGTMSCSVLPELS